MRIINKLEDCINKRPIISLFLSVFVGWALSWFLPSKPVSVGSMPPKELTCTLNYSHRLIKRGTTDQKLQILYDGQIVDDPRIFDITITNTGDFFSCIQVSSVPNILDVTPESVFPLD